MAFWSKKHSVSDVKAMKGVIVDYRPKILKTRVLSGEHLLVVGGVDCGVHVEN